MQEKWSLVEEMTGWELQSGFLISSSFSKLLKGHTPSCQYRALFGYIGSSLIVKERERETGKLMGSVLTKVSPDIDRRQYIFWAIFCVL